MVNILSKISLPHTTKGLPTFISHVEVIIHEQKYFYIYFNHILAILAFIFSVSKPKDHGIYQLITMGRPVAS